MLRQGLDKAGFNNVRIVAADDYEAEFEMNLARDMLLDPELSSAVDIFGFVEFLTTHVFFGVISNT